MKRIIFGIVILIICNTVIAQSITTLSADYIFAKTSLTSPAFAGNGYFTGPVHTSMGNVGIGDGTDSAVGTTLVGGTLNSYLQSNLYYAAGFKNFATGYATSLFADDNVGTIGLYTYASVAANAARGALGASVVLDQSTLTITGHVQPIGGTAPSIANGACGAGANGSIAGVDQSGKITIGAAATTACAVSFGAAFTTAPSACTFSPATAASAAVTVLPYISAIGVNGFTLSGAALATTSWYYTCF